MKEELRSQADYLQNEVSRLGHDLSEVKQAYQEKSRKCNAWSKVRYVYIVYALHISK